MGRKREDEAVTPKIFVEDEVASVTGVSFTVAEDTVLESLPPVIGINDVVPVIFGCLAVLERAEEDSCLFNREIGP